MANPATDRAVCKGCGQQKHATMFFWDRRYGRPRSKCKACCKAIWKSSTRTPEQRAFYRRCIGAVDAAVEYLPFHAIARVAAIKKEIRAIKRRATANAAELRKAAQQARPKHQPRYHPEPLAPSTPERAHIRLSGKWAVGAQAFVVVDTDVVEFLSQWRWRAKWNASHSTCYAIRSARAADREQHGSTVRMHRVLTGLSRFDGWEPDHQNGNGLDNRRDNLVVGDRRANLLTRRRAA